MVARGRGQFPCVHVLNEETLNISSETSCQNRKWLLGDPLQIELKFDPSKNMTAKDVTSFPCVPI